MMHVNRNLSSSIFRWHGLKFIIALRLSMLIALELVLVEEKGCISSLQGYTAIET